MVVALLEFWGIVVCWMLAFGVLSWLYMRIATTRAAEAGHAASAAPTAAPASAAVLGRSAMIAPPNRQNARTCSSAGTPCSR